MVPVVALRKESVDRNRPGLVTGCEHIRSLSARRAWIEIVCGTVTAYPIFPSLSARRAWIEIPVTDKAWALEDGRSPQGERG